MTAISFDHTLLQHLDALNEEERLARIEDLLHRLNFERRLVSLAPNQLKAMADRSLSTGDITRLNACRDSGERNKVFASAARTLYFRELGWTAYLNGEVKEPPVPAEKGIPENYWRPGFSCPVPTTVREMMLALQELPPDLPVWLDGGEHRAALTVTGYATDQQRLEIR